MWVNKGDLQSSAGNSVPCVRDSSLIDESPCFKNTADHVVPAKCWVMTLGNGGDGQLGLGPGVDDISTSTPKRVPELRDIVQVAVGGMHTVCLDFQGKVKAVLLVLVFGLGLESKLFHL